MVCVWRWALSSKNTWTIATSFLLFCKKILSTVALSAKKSYVLSWARTQATSENIKILNKGVGDYGYHRLWTVPAFNELPLLASTELYYSWKRNTAVVLHNQLSDHGNWKLLAQMINSHYNPFMMPHVSSSILVVSNLLSSLFNWFRLVPDWFRLVLQTTYCLIIAKKKWYFAFAYQF